MKYSGLYIPEIVATNIEDLNDQEIAELLRAGSRYVRLGRTTNFRKGTLQHLLWNELRESSDILDDTITKVQLEEAQYV